MYEKDTVKERKRPRIKSENFWMRKETRQKSYRIQDWERTWLQGWKEKEKKYMMERGIQGENMEGKLE